MPSPASKAAKKDWRCFHCDEVFTDEESARDHFGSDNYETGETPGCISPLRTDEKLRLKEVREANEHAMKMQRSAEANDEAEGLLQQYREEIGRLFGMVGGVKASTPHQAWLVLDAKQGEVLALEERVKHLEAQAGVEPDSIAKTAAEKPVKELAKKAGSAETGGEKAAHCGDKHLAMQPNGHCLNCGETERTSCDHPHLDGIDQTTGPNKVWECQACKGLFREVKDGIYAKWVATFHRTPQNQTVLSGVEEVHEGTTAEKADV